MITLRFLADLSTAETANALGITRAHVAVLSHRALGALRSAIAGIERAGAGRDHPAPSPVARRHSDAQPGDDR